MCGEKNVNMLVDCLRVVSYSESVIYTPTRSSVCNGLQTLVLCFLCRYRAESWNHIVNKESFIMLICLRNLHFLLFADILEKNRSGKDVGR